MLRYIANFLSNFLRVVKALFTVAHIDLSSNGRVIKKSSIDRHSKVYTPCFLTNVSVGKGSYISTNAKIGNTRIGKFCSIGPNLVCGWGIHPVSGLSTSPVFYSTAKQAGFTYAKVDSAVESLDITIGNDVFIGANVTILDGVNIGDGAVIGAGAVVTKDVPPYAIVAGCPAVVKKYRFTNDQIEKLLAIKWWDGEEDMLQKVASNLLQVEYFLGSSSKEHN